MKIHRVAPLIAEARREAALDRMTDDAAAVLARHVRKANETHTWCGLGCEPPWPCDAYRAALALDAATERVARLEAALTAITAMADRYSAEDRFGVYPFGLFGAIDTHRYLVSAAARKALAGEGVE